MWPPVQTTTPLRAWMFTAWPPFATVMPSTRPELRVSRMIEVILCLSKICAPFLRALSSSRRTRPEPLRLRCGAMTPLGMCHSLVTKMRSTVDASGERIGFSMNSTPFSIRNSYVATFSSAKTRTRSRSLNRLSAWS